jgi:hypothetical protein
MRIKEKYWITKLLDYQITETQGSDYIITESPYCWIRKLHEEHA